MSNRDYCEPPKDVATKSESRKTLNKKATRLEVVRERLFLNGSAADAGGVYQGFKYSSGKFTSIKFPEAFSTSVGAINDNGVIIGSYVNGNLENPPQGFILQNGVYKALNFVPSDINNAGTMVAGSSIIFSNGSSKTVHAPNSASTNLFAINDLGVVTGNANYPASGGAFTWKNFTAVCH